jgi:hypothetical protein
MSLTITLPPEVESRLREDARRELVPVEEVAARRLQEAELLRRIFAYFPPEETREMRALGRKRQADGALSAAEAERLMELAHRREEKNAARLSDILQLARLRGVSHRQVMAELGIRPHRVG